MGRWLGLFCRHEWEIMQRSNVVEKDGATPWAFLYILKCKHCGDIKSKRIKP